MSSTYLSAHDAESSSVRPRNRRLISVEGGSPPREPPTTKGTSRLASGSSTPRRGASPVPAARLDVAPPEAASRNSSRKGKGVAASGSESGFLNRSWTASWNSVQDLAVGWLSSGTRTNLTSPQESHAGNRNGSRTRPWAKESQTTDTRPTIQDVGAGVIAERESALQAARMASLLESHDGVNGGLDVAGRFKLRTSDDLSRQSSDPAAEVDEIHAYIHHVQPADTYAGIILKYGCSDDQFRKLNGLWSHSSITTRKWVALPVDACEVKSRPCAAPVDLVQAPDLLAPTPEAEEETYGWRATDSMSQQQAEDIFGSSRTNASAVPEEKTLEDSSTPWTHVRWVSIDTIKEPVEIGRISKRAFGYFRPRRKRSLLSAMSTRSTPRQSLDAPSTTQASRDGVDDRAGPSSRRQSLLSNRPNLGIGSVGISTPASTRSRMGSAGADSRPSWMRQPGGVGSMNRNVRTPGPESDPLNSWAKKHFPALILDSLPSMAVTGAETARVGFSTEGGAIAEAPSEGAKDLSGQGTGLDRAAAAVETWLRGALAKRPGTPARGEWGSGEGGDLIELTDTQSDDGGKSGWAADSSLNFGSLLGTETGGGSSGRADTGALKRWNNKENKDD